MNAKHTRAAIRDMIRELGGRPWPSAGGMFHLPIPHQDRGYLKVETSVGPCSTHLGVDRWPCRDLSGDGSAWLTINVWPYAARYTERTQRANTMPHCRSYDALLVLTEEAVDCLRLWLPWEIAQQQHLTNEQEPR